MFCILCFFLSHVTFQVFASTGVQEICKIDISKLCPQATLHFVFCVFFYSNNNLIRIKWFGHSRMKHSSVLVIAKVTMCGRVTCLSLCVISLKIEISFWVEKTINYIITPHSINIHVFINVLSCDFSLFVIVPCVCWIQIKTAHQTLFDRCYNYI